MANENGLYFELGIRDKITDKIKVMAEQAEQLGGKIDKSVAILTELDKRIKNLGQIKNLVSSSDAKEVEALKKQIEELQKQMKNFKVGDPKAMETALKEMESRYTATIREVVTQNALLSKSMDDLKKNMKKSSGGGTKATDDETKALEQQARAVEKLKTERYKLMETYRDMKRASYSGKMLGLDTSNLSKYMAAMREQFNKAKAMMSSGGFTTQDVAGLFNASFKQQMRTYSAATKEQISLNSKFASSNKEAAESLKNFVPTSAGGNFEQRFAEARQRLGAALKAFKEPTLDKQLENSLREKLRGYEEILSGGGSLKKRARKDYEDVKQRVEALDLLKQRLDSAKAAYRALVAESNRPFATQLGALQKQNLYDSLKTAHFDANSMENQRSKNTLAKMSEHYNEEVRAAEKAEREKVRAAEKAEREKVRAAEKSEREEKIASNNKLQNVDRLTKAQIRLNELMGKYSELNSRRTALGLPSVGGKEMSQMERLHTLLEWMKGRDSIVKSATMDTRYLGAPLMGRFSNWNTALGGYNKALSQHEQAQKKAADAAQANARSQEQLVRTMQQATNAAKEQSRMYSEMKNWAQMYFSFYGAKDFLQSIIQVGGEFEVQHIALQNIIGDMQKGTAIYNQIKALSVQSPFTFSQLTNNTRQLSAYAIPYEELYDTTKRLSDMSAGLGVDFYRLSLAYGQVRGASVLRGQELRQFTEAGIPMVQALADEFTKLEGKIVTTGDILNKYVPGKRVPFEMVKKVLWEMTDEGGRFYNMQEKLADTLAGKFSNLRDAWEIMLSDLAKGESASGQILKGAIQGLTTVIHLLREISPFLLSYGAVKVGGALLGGDGAKMASGIAKGQESFRQAALAAQISGSRQLSLIEKDILASKGKITGFEVSMMNNADLLNRSAALRLALQKKLSADAATQLRIEGLITAEEEKQIIAGKRLRLTTALVWQNLKAVPSRMLGFVGGMFTSVTFWLTAVAGAFMYFKTKSDEAEQKSKELRESMQQAASSFADTMKGLGDKPTDNKGLTAAVDQMLEALKKVENAADMKRINDEADAIKSLGDKYDYLAEKMKIANGARQDIGNNEAMLDMVEIADSGRNIFKNDNLEDFVETYQNVNKLVEGIGVSLQKNASIKGLLSKWNDNDFFPVLKGKSVTETIEYLRSATLPGASTDYISEGAGELEKTFIKNYINRLNDRSKAFSEAAAHISLLSESAFDAAAKNSGWNADDKVEATTEKIIATMNAYIESVEGISNDARDKMQGFSSVIAEFAMSFAEGGDDAVREAFEFMRKKLNEGWDFENLTKAQEDAIAKFVQDTISKYKIAGGKYADYIAKHPIQANLIIRLKTILSGGLGDVLTKLKPNAQTIWDTLTEKQGTGNNERRKYLGKWMTREQFNQSFDTEGGYAGYKDQKVQAVNNAYNAWQKAKHSKTKGGKEIAKQLETEYKEVRADYDLEFDDDPLNLNGKGLEKKHKDKNKRKEDVELKNARNRMSRLEKVKQLYDKYVQSGYSAEEALNRVRNSGMSYANALPSSIKTKDALDKWQKEQIRAIRGSLKPTTEERKTALDEWLSKSLTFNMDALKKALADIGEQMQKAIKEGTDKWNLFKSIDEKFQDKDLASRLAYGKSGMQTKVSDTIKQEIESMLPQIQALQVVSEDEKKYVDAFLKKKNISINGGSDYDGVVGALNGRYGADVKMRSAVLAQLVKAGNLDSKSAEILGRVATNYTFDDVKDWKQSQFENVFGTGFGKTLYDLVQSQLEAIKQEAQEQVKKLVDSLTQVQSEYAKLQAELRKADDDKNRINANEKLTPIEKQQATSAIDAQMATKVLQASPEYINFFNAALTMTTEKAEEVGKKIRENLDERMRAGLITAEDYTKEVGRINQQLDKVRKNKGEYWALFTGGLNGVADYRVNKALDSYNKAVANEKDATDRYNEKLRSGDVKGALKELGKVFNAQKDKEKAEKELEQAKKLKEAFEDTAKVVEKIDNLIQGISEAVNAVVEMGDALGWDTSAGSTLGDLQEGASVIAGLSSGTKSIVSSAMNGDWGGVLGGVFKTLTGPITSIAKYHDAKLDRQIEISEEQKHILENLQSSMETYFNRTLGGIYKAEMTDRVRGRLTEISDEYKAYKKASGEKGFFGRFAANMASQKKATGEQAQKALDTKSYYEAELALLMAQRDQVETQRNAEASKKKNDKTKLSDYDKSLDDLDDKIRNFARDMEKSLYDIDVKTWANDLASAIVGAWQKGENALDAYKAKAQDILKGLVSKVVATKIWEVLMEPLQKDIDARMTKNHGKLSEDDMVAITSGILDIYSKGTQQTQAMLDHVEAEANKMGLTMKETGSANGGNAIKSITEDQADILISYVNGMRADLSIHVQRFREYLDRQLPGMTNLFEQQLAQLKAIENNTHRNADAAEDIRNTLDSIVSGVKKLAVKNYA